MQAQIYTRLEIGGTRFEMVIMSPNSGSNIGTSQIQESFKDRRIEGRHQTLS